MGGTFIFTENGEAQWWCNYLVDCSDTLLSLLLFLVFSLRGGGGKKKHFLGVFIISFILFKKSNRLLSKLFARNMQTSVRAKVQKQETSNFTACFCSQLWWDLFSAWTNLQKSLFKILSFSIKLQLFIYNSVLNRLLFRTHFGRQLSVLTCSVRDLRPEEF